MLKTFLTPRWLGWHALTLASLVALARIGWWQLERARGDGNWQNYGYAVQWWLFGFFAIFLWAKLVLDELDPTRLEIRQVMTPEALSAVDGQAQPSAPAPLEAEDDELAAYNRHLARLDERSHR